MPTVLQSLRREQAVLLLHPCDNVGVARETLAAGEAVQVAGVWIEAAARIPAGHKLAVRTIPSGCPVLRYGERIGTAACRIEAGDHVHTHNLCSGDIDLNYEFPPAEKDIELPETGATFPGYPRADGRAGTRNYVAVVAASNCSAHVVSRIAAHYQGRTLPEGVDGVAAFPHSDGCGHSIGPDTDQLQRTIAGLLAHPNVAAAVIVGLGCEVNLVERYAAGPCASEALVSLTLQKCGGTGATIAEGVAAVDRQLNRAAALKRSPVPISKLVLGLNCGGSDAFSGVTANPALGRCSDKLVAAGGTAVLAETPEIFGAEHLLVRRAKNRAVAERLLAVISRYREYLSRSGAVFDDNPSPGNKEGGLSSIIEKSLGAVSKAGSSPLIDVLEYAERVRGRGLVYMNTPGYDPVSITGLAAGGANILGFTTGRGSAIGFPIVPVVKIATNTAVFCSMRENMDVNAGSILDATATVEAVGSEIFDFMLEVASGRRTASEQLGHAEFVPWRIGPVL